MTERWLPITGFEGRYEVSDLGHVRGVDRLVRRRWGFANYRGKVLKPRADGDGYLFVTLGKNGPQRPIHKLVAAAFCQNPARLPEVDHLDRSKTNNASANLRWCTKSINGINRDNAKRIPEVTKRAIRADVLAGVPIMLVAAKHKVSRVHVRRLAAA